MICLNNVSLFASTRPNVFSPQKNRRSTFLSCTKFLDEIFVVTTVEHISVGSTKSEESKPIELQMNLFKTQLKSLDWKESQPHDAFAVLSSIDPEYLSLNCMGK